MSFPYASIFILLLFMCACEEDVSLLDGDCSIFIRSCTWDGLDATSATAQGLDSAAFRKQLIGSWETVWLDCEDALLIGNARRCRRVRAVEKDSYEFLANGEVRIDLASTREFQANYEVIPHANGDDFIIQLDIPPDILANIHPEYSSLTWTRMVAGELGIPGFLPNDVCTPLYLKQ